MAVIFMGVDGEMSGPNLSEGHLLIQIGVAWRNPAGTFEVFRSDIGQPTAVIDERARAVHGFSDARIVSGPTPESVDDALFEWLVARGASEDARRIVPIGWNVGAFDIPFVRLDLPRSAGLLSRRTCDLNAVTFTLAGAIIDRGNVWSGAGLKRNARRYADETLTVELPDLAAAGRHDAAYDAASAVLEWEWLRAQIRNS